MSYLEKYLNEGNGLFLWQFPKEKTLLMLGHVLVDSGELQEGGSTYKKTPFLLIGLAPCPSNVNSSD